MIGLEAAGAPAVEGQLVRAGHDEQRTRAVPLRGITQVVIVAWAYAIYAGFRNLATGPAVVSLRDGEKILAAERFLHLDFERQLQHFVLHLSWLVDLCNLCYSATHIVVPIAVLVLLYRRTPARYAVWRDTFLILLGMALIGFALFPVRPPWLMPASYHFADTSHFLAGTHPSGPRGLNLNAVPTPSSLWQFSNPYAAMPSLHTTWAIWAALAAWPVVRRRWVKVLLALYPPAMFASVVVTANHWVLDAVIGVIVLGGSYGVARAIDEIRDAPFVWRRLRTVQPTPLRKYLRKSR